ncbi:biotin/lipoyl-containing protein [Helicovermis profundi]|uniref:Biotin/lipoyl-binding protein n=1 Tax=Helicovermis profundi TaxID=3065157 RepID=A0AAU9E662_9FIRM|nr:biotin/lipoyl-binding protein [Clostridia bacterium S502]
MKKFNITVNGKTFEVEVEEVGGSSVSAPRAVSATPAAPTPKAAPAPKVAPKAAPKAAPAGGNSINAPMPGTVLDVKVSEGDSVTDGQVLLILEAMKMENEIMAPSAGKIVSVQVQNGASVNSGDVLIVME